MEPTPAAREEAKRHPNGWVYAIEGTFSADERVPTECIAGAWKVDADGNIVGEFERNPNFKPKAKSHLLFATLRR
jgi:hypothetical protein